MRRPAAPRSQPPSSLARGLTGIAGEVRRILLGSEMRSGAGGSIEIRIYVFRRNTRLCPVCAKVVSPLKLQVVLAAGTLIALLEAARLPNDASQAAKWIVGQVLDGGWKVVRR